MDRRVSLLVVALVLVLGRVSLAIADDDIVDGFVDTRDVWREAVSDTMFFQKAGLFIVLISGLVFWLCAPKTLRDDLLRSSWERMADSTNAILARLSQISIRDRLRRTAGSNRAYFAAIARMRRHLRMDDASQGPKDSE